MINKVEICGVNTSKLPILSNEEKKELLEKIKKHLDFHNKAWYYTTVRDEKKAEFTLTSAHT